MHELEMIIWDLNYLTSIKEIDQVVESNSELENLQAKFQTFSKNYQRYDQIRYIDEKGMEKVRINSIMETHIS